MPTMLRPVWGRRLWRDRLRLRQRGRSVVQVRRRLSRPCPRRRHQPPLLTTADLESEKSAGPCPALFLHCPVSLGVQSAALLRVTSGVPRVGAPDFAETTDPQWRTFPRSPAATRACAVAAVGARRGGARAGTGRRRAGIGPDRRGDRRILPFARRARRCGSRPGSGDAAPTIAACCSHRRKPTSSTPSRYNVKGFVARDPVRPARRSRRASSAPR